VMTEVRKAREAAALLWVWTVLYETGQCPGLERLWRDEAPFPCLADAEQKQEADHEEGGAHRGEYHSAPAEEAGGNGDDDVVRQIANVSSGDDGCSAGARTTRRSAAFTDHVLQYAHCVGVEEPLCKAKDIQATATVSTSLHAAEGRAAVGSAGEGWLTAETS
jgi:hypothetical protein